MAEKKKVKSTGAKSATRKTTAKKSTTKAKRNPYEPKDFSTLRDVPFFEGKWK